MEASQGRIDYTSLKLDRPQRERSTAIASRLLESVMARREVTVTYDLVKECLLAAVLSVQVFETFEATGLMGDVPSKAEFLRDLERIQAIRSRAGNGGSDAGR